MKLTDLSFLRRNQSPLCLSLAVELDFNCMLKWGLIKVESRLLIDFPATRQAFLHCLPSVKHSCSLRHDITHSVDTESQSICLPSRLSSQLHAMLVFTGAYCMLKRGALDFFLTWQISHWCCSLFTWKCFASSESSPTLPAYVWLPSIPFSKPRALYSYLLQLPLKQFPVQNVDTFILHRSILLVHRLFIINYWNKSVEILSY